MLCELRGKITHFFQHTTFFNLINLYGRDMNGVKAPRRGSAGLIVILGPEIPRVGGETETA